jgi:hypothetical protein
MNVIFKKHLLFMICDKCNKEKAKAKELLF